MTHQADEVHEKPIESEHLTSKRFPRRVVYVLRPVEPLTTPQLVLKTNEIMLSNIVQNVFRVRAMMLVSRLPAMMASNSRLPFDFNQSLQFNRYYSSDDTQKKVDFAKIPASEWKKKLTPEQFEVCRQSATEPAFSGEYYTHKGTGTYNCACCGTTLFDSDTKYDSGSGWPSFYEPHKDDSATNVAEKPDNSGGRSRTEVICKQCQAHLGHVFPDGPEPTGLRYCINSLSLKFNAKKT